MILHDIFTTPLSRAKRLIWFSYIEVVTIELKINHIVVFHWVISKNMSRYSNESITVSDLLFLKCCSWRKIKSILLYPTIVCIYIVAQRYWKLCLAGYVNHREEFMETKQMYCQHEAPRELKLLPYPVLRAWNSLVKAAEKVHHTIVKSRVWGKETKLLWYFTVNPSSR